jgi:lysophospholipase L1-like esterase
MGLGTAWRRRSEAGILARSKRHIAGSLLVLLVSLVASLLAAELIVRGLGVAPEVYPVQRGRFQLSSNPLIRFELVPHFESDTAGPMIDFRGKGNSLGFRDREHAIEKPPGTYRILVLGDSITQGFGIEATDDVFTAVLETKLRTEGVNAEVLNFGVSGYNTEQEVETLREKGVQFDPDLVVLAFCANDTAPASRKILRELHREDARQGALWSLSPILLESALLRLVSASYPRVQALFVDPPRDAERISRDALRQHFDALGGMSRQHGFDVLVVWFPRMKGDDEAADLRREVGSLSRSHGFRFHDLTPDLQVCSADGPVALDRLHPNALGHRCAGDGIARAVRSMVR